VGRVIGEERPHLGPVRLGFGREVEVHIGTVHTVAGEVPDRPSVGTSRRS
jgi:hypothetical protein